MWLNTDPNCLLVIWPCISQLGQETLMTWVEASQALRWSDSGTAWHHLAPVSNGLDTSIPLLRHNRPALPSLMSSLYVSAPSSHTHITNTRQSTTHLRRRVMNRGVRQKREREMERKERGEVHGEKEQWRCQQRTGETDSREGKNGD